MTVQEVIDVYSSSANIEFPNQSHGLSQETVAKHFEIYGPNIMKPPPQKPWYRKWLDCVLNFFNILLIFSGILCYIVYAMDNTNSVRSFLSM
jgi:sodium/potassium-transporting ATPase subunit alpha